MSSNLSSIFQKTNDFLTLDIDNINAQSTKEVKNIKDWEVLTPSGWSDFKQVKKIKKPVYYLLTTEDNIEIEASPYHKLKMEDDSFKYMVHIKPGDELCEGKVVKSNIRVEKKVELFDLLGVEINNEYYANGIISHNCVASDTFITVKNTETGEIRRVKISEVKKNKEYF